MVESIAVLYTPTSLTVIVPPLEFLKRRSRVNDPLGALIVNPEPEEDRYSSWLDDVPSAIIVARAKSVGVTDVVPVPSTMPTCTDDI